jgi:NAD(P)H-dependent flavin oxidoreductase YrpB (nitropropane dioxygenase family)
MAERILPTKLCKILEIEYPIILAGMATIAGVELTAAVSEAGGLGVIGALEMTPDELDVAIRQVKSLTSKPFGVDSVAPIGAIQSGTVEELRNLVTEESGLYAECKRRAGHEVEQILKTLNIRTGS